MLTQRDFLSPTWLRFKEQAAARLAEFRESNDAPVAEGLTAHNRGHIAELKFWLDLENALPVPPIDTGHP